MKFEIDEQTLKDLEVFSNDDNHKSIYKLFSPTKTAGGREKLYRLLSSPLTDLNEINERKNIFAFFQEHLPSGLTVDKDALNFAEYYLKHGEYLNRPPTKFSAINRLIMDKVSSGGDYFLLHEGVSSIIKLLKAIHQFSLSLAEKVKEHDCPKRILDNNNEALNIFSLPEYVKILNAKKFSPYERAKLDYMFRYIHKKHILFFLKLIYEYDAFLTVVRTAEKYNFTNAEMLPKEENNLQIEGLFHPFVENGVANDVNFDNSSNLLFITGPNMAGKSTLLKAIGISVYLAHTGFPVPAKKMKLSLLSGISTTINISDNLNSGYSHFYAEVMRIKNVANKLKQHNNMLVIFDELFRGTNIKDAYDGTLSIVSAFARIKTSFFIISSHIVEVTKELQNNKNIKFSYLEILEKDGHPTYTYKMKDGVTDIRLGMYIIRKEKIIDIINEVNN